MITYGFDVMIERSPVDPEAAGDDVYRGVVRLGNDVVYRTIVRNLGGPSAEQDMTYEVMRQFAKLFAAALEPHV